MKVQALIYIVFAFVALVLGGMVVILKNQLNAKDFELSTANKTIEAQAESIGRLTAQRKVDDRIVTELTKGLAELKTSSEEQTAAIADLEKSDPDAKNFLSLPLPDSLKRLLSGGTAGSGSRASGTP